MRQTCVDLQAASLLSHNCDARGLFWCRSQSHTWSRFIEIRYSFRKLVRNIVGPPPQTTWDSPWHIILHAWNERVNYFVKPSGIPTWTTSCLQQHWRFARYIANLAANRCVKRVLHWTPMGNATVGRPHSVLESKIQGFCCYKLLGNWVDLAKSDVWIDMTDDFVNFCFSQRWQWRCICFNFRLLCHFCLRPKEGSPHCVQAWNEIYSHDT